MIIFGSALPSFTSHGDAEVSFQKVPCHFLVTGLFLTTEIPFPCTKSPLKAPRGVSEFNFFTKALHLPPKEDWSSFPIGLVSDN